MVADIGSDESIDQSELRALTAQIVAAYLANHPSVLAEVPTIIQAVHQALRGVGKPPAGEVKKARAPAVPIRRSVTPDYLICLEDGVRMTMLKRHLRTAHALTPEEYRARWGLAWDYPMAAPGYTEARSVLARKIGLGRRPGTGRPDPGDAAGPDAAADKTPAKDESERSRRPRRKPPRRSPAA